MGRTNFFYLLIALLILLIGIPLADDLELASAPLVRGSAFSLLLIIGVWSLRGGAKVFRIGMTFAVLGVALNLLAANSDSIALLYGSFLAMFGFLFVAIAFTLRSVAVGDEISANRLIGAVCVYLLLGVIWAYAYSILALVSPDSFSGFSPWSDRAWDSEWLYFSFVTMTTLGYGDILPVSATARSLAYLQAIFGQFYIAVLVAGLVSVYVSKKGEK